MTNDPKPDYNCSQRDLYSVCETAWGNFESHLAEFSAFKAIYTSSYAATAKLEIDAANRLPDDEVSAAGGITDEMSLRDRFDQLDVDHH